MSENEAEMRDLFAAACLIGLCAVHGVEVDEAAPKRIYQFANRMIAERRKWMNRDEAKSSNN